FFDNLAGKKVFRHDEQVDDSKRLEVVVHQEQARIIAGGKTFTFGLESAVDDPRSELAFLALEFELLFAGRVKEVGEWRVVGEGRNLRVAAVGTICPRADPRLRPY